MKFRRLLTIYVLSIALFASAPCAADPPPVTSIIDAKLAADTTPVSLTGAIVTAANSSLFYIEADDRSSGMYAQKDAHGKSGGMRANVTGTVQTDSDGQRYIAADTATENGAGSVQPIALSNRDVGGSDLPSSIAGGGQKGVPGGVGLNNIGLLVRIRGRVTYGGDGFFYIDDGQGLVDGSGYRGVKVIGYMPLCDGMDPLGWYVEVTGLSVISRNIDGPCRAVWSTKVSLVSLIDTPSGLAYANLRVGTGATAEAGSTVAVHYTLWLTTCQEMDSSVGRGPLEFTLGQGQVIAGFDGGILGMKVGGKRFLVIPPELGYGAGGTLTIPPNSYLLFEVELVSVSN